MNVTPKVFISSTSADLHSVRELVRDALLNIGCLPVVQDHFPPDYRDVAGMLRAKIEECDAMIHIAGLRYGAEPDPDSLPEGVPRRSYTQMEVDLARELKLEKVFTFVCPEDFPYDETDAEGEPLEDESEELRQLQREHRERLLNQKELRYRVGSPEALESKVREIQLELDQVKSELRKTRGKMLGVGASIALALVLLAVGVFFVFQQQKDQGGNVTALREQFEKNPGLIGENLKEFVRQNAAVEIHKFAGQWERIAQIESSRDKQLNEIDDLVAFIRKGLSDSADPIFVRASSILANSDPKTGGPGNALVYLKASRGRILSEVDRLAADKEEAIAKMREKLRAVFLEAEIHEKAFEWEEALDDLRLVVEKAPLWWEALNELGNLCRERALWKESEKCLRLALSIATIEQKPSSQNDLAVLLESVGNYEEAEPLYHESLDGMQRVLGREHPETLTLINNLAVFLESIGNYEKAEPLYREALEGRERVLGHEHPDTLTSVNNLAVFLQSAGKYEEAGPLYRTALEYRERVLGREHPDTLTSINNLAVFLESSGKHEEAGPLYEVALESRERVLGREHPDTLTSINNLAGFLESIGNYKEAELLYREVLEGIEKVLGREHPDALTSINNLAAFFESTGNYEKAEPLYREALEGRERVLGREHPDTLTSINNLAVFLASVENYEEAGPLYREALESMERVLGHEHPDTLTSINNLAGFLESTGDFEEVEPLYRDALEGRERVLGREHPDTLTSINNLAVFLASTGRYEEAEPLYRELVKISETVNGKENATTMLYTYNLASDLVDLNQSDEARSLLEELVDTLSISVGSSLTLVGQACYQLARCDLRDRRLDSAEEWILEANQRYDEQESIAGFDSPNRAECVDLYLIVLKEAGVKPDEVRSRLDKLRFSEDTISGLIERFNAIE